MLYCNHHKKYTMYQVIEHYHQEDCRYKSKAVKGKTLEETNQRIECYFEHESDVIEYLERYYGGYYKAGKNCYGHILDLENSKYVVLENDITKSQIEFVFPTIEHFSVIVKFIEDDAEMMKHTEHIVSLIKDVCSKNDVTIKTTRKDYFNSYYWVYTRKLSKNMSVCPIDILMQKKKKITLGGEEYIIDKTIYKITIYKMGDTVCICLKGPKDTRIPLVKTEVVTSNANYGKYPSKHTNYILSQANIDKIVEKLQSKNSALKTK